MIDDVGDKEICDGLGISCFESSCGYPFGEVIDGDYDVSFSSAGNRQGSHDINSNLVEGLRCFLNRFQGCFTLSSFSFLTSLAGADILNDVILHSGPIVVSGSFVVGVVLAEVTGEW